MDLMTLNDIKSSLALIDSREANNFLEYYIDDIFWENNNKRSKYRLVPVIIQDEGVVLGKLLVIELATMDPVYATEFLESSNVFYLLIFLLQDKEIYKYLGESKENTTLGLLTSLHFLYSKELVRHRAITLEEKLKLNFNKGN